jgi:hypothetical protein
MNKSKEHIIPQTVFGKLRSKKILCNVCNGKLSHLDTRLGDSLLFATSLIDHKKDRKKKPSKKLMEETKTGKKYAVGPGFRAEEYSPDIQKKVNDDGTIEERFKGDPKNFKKYKKSIEKKYKGRKIKIVRQKEVKTRPQLEDHTEISIAELGLPLLKIAIDYYMDSGNDITHIKNAINLLKSGSGGEDITWYYYPRKKVINKKTHCEVLNTLVLIGNHSNKLLCCYISIYGAFNFLVCLNDNYEGSDLEEVYIHDIRNGVVEREINIHLDRQSVEEIFNDRIIPDAELSESSTELFGILRSDAVHTNLKIILQRVIAENCDKNLNEIWKIAETEFNEIPISDWENWKICVPHKKEWDQRKDCGCGSDKLSFELHGNIDNDFKEVLLISRCNQCGKTEKHGYLVPF